MEPLDLVGEMVRLFEEVGIVRAIAEAGLG
jgi:hypothetical protein